MQRKLPWGDQEAARKLKDAWHATDSDGKSTLARSLKVAKGTLANFVSDVTTPETETTPYPSFNILSPKHTKKTAEEMGLVVADWHGGKKTSSYSSAVLRQRVEYLTERVLNIIDLHQPIRKLHVFMVGDMAQGENVYQGSKVEEAEMGARLQIKQVLIPAMSGLLISTSQAVEEVRAYGVKGNHGKYDKAAPSGTNWDSFFYDMLQSALINQDRIHIHPADNFYQLISILGWRFFIIHGDQVNATNGIPLFAMRRKMQDWYAHVGGFHYAYAGHFHSHAADQVNSVADYTICPPLVTGDSWALEKIGRSSRPVQLCFGIHPKYGRTWEYRLYTDEKYLPEPFEEPEGEIVVSA